MELQFDKEIDAILRRTPKGASVDMANKDHIDADTISAFAENALPEKAKVLYLKHFADCGRCRKLLAASMSWPRADQRGLGVAAPVAATSIPWYSRLFRIPKLAMVMGGLVLVFGGFLGYWAVQSSRDASNATVSQVTDQDQRGGPYVGDESVANANTSSNANATMANTANRAPNTKVSNTADSGTTGKGSGSASGGAANKPENRTADEARPVAMAPPPAGAPKPEDERGTEDDKSKNAGSKEARSDSQFDRMSRDSKKVAGPYRNAGPRAQQQVTDTNLAADQNAQGSAVGGTTRNAGGKKFEKRSGAWYDTAYRGQATKNVTRATDDYQKLDGGLRSIAESIGGVVVIVWKGTAYRIQ